MDKLQNPPRRISDTTSSPRTGRLPHSLVSCSARSPYRRYPRRPRPLLPPPPPSPTPPCFPSALPLPCSCAALLLRAAAALLMRRLAPPRHHRLHRHRRPGKVGYFTKAPRRLRRPAALISRRQERLDLVSNGEEKPQDVILVLHRRNPLTGTLSHGQL